MTKGFDEYERDYLKRLEEKKNSDEIQNIHNSTPYYYQEKVEEIDFVIMGLIRNGVKKLQSLFERLGKSGKVGFLDLTKRINKLERMDYLTVSKEGGWVERNTNPTIIIEKKGEEIIEKKILELEENWALLMKHYEAKEKEPLRNEMSNMKGMFPMMFIMGIAHGTIMAQMLQMNHMNLNDYFINEPIQIDYLTDPNGEPYTSESGEDFESGGFEVGF